MPARWRGWRWYDGDWPAAVRLEGEQGNARGSGYLALIAVSVDILRWSELCERVEAFDARAQLVGRWIWWPHVFSGVSEIEVLSQSSGGRLVGVVLLQSTESCCLSAVMVLEMKRRGCSRGRIRFCRNRPSGTLGQLDNDRQTRRHDAAVAASLVAQIGSHSTPLHSGGFGSHHGWCAGG